MLGYSVAELQGMELPTDCAEDRERVMANIQPGRASSAEHAMLCKDGTRIVVESHGRLCCPGSPRRHTAIRDITGASRRRASCKPPATLLHYSLRHVFRRLAGDG